MQLLKTDSKQFYTEEHMAEVSSHMGKTDKSLQQLLDVAKGEFDAVKGKLDTIYAKATTKSSITDKKGILSRIEVIEEKIKDFVKQKDIEAVTAEVAKLVSEGKFNKQRLTSLEEQVDEIVERIEQIELGHQAFAEFREKLSKNVSMPAEEKKLLLTRLSKIEEKLEQLGDPKEIVEYIATMNQEIAYNSDRVNDLESMVESLLGTEVIISDSNNNNGEVAMLGHDTSM